MYLLRNWKQVCDANEVHWIARQRATCKKLIQASSQQLAMGYNKLILSYKLRRELIWKAIRFIIESQKNTNSLQLNMAYKSLKQRRNK